VKGIVFNLLEEIVTRDAGEDAWDDVLGDARVGGAYTALGSYPDEELSLLVGAIGRRLDRPPGEVVRWLGREAFPRFAARHPELVEPHGATRPLVLALNDIIHPEVRKLHPGAEVPYFDVESPAADRIALGYRSPRRLCALAEGLLEGCATHFGETIAIEQPLCMLRGDELCRLEISLAR